MHQVEITKAPYIVKIKLVIKAIVITLFLPGSVIGLIPWFILHAASEPVAIHISPATVIGAIMGLTGLTCLVQCIWGFAFHGRGTLAPVDPPEVLVVQGLYRFTRNPMYSSVLLVLVSEALFFWNFSLLIYAAAAFLIFHAFVMFYEEPHLRATFGESYERYVNAVPRWLISLRRNRMEK